MNDVLQTMRNHVSVRKYKSEPIPQETIEQLVEAAQHAASSNFVQAYSVIAVTDPDIKAECAQLTYNDHVKDAAVFFVICADYHRLALAGKKHDVTIHTETTENFLVATVDASLFAQNLTLASESLGYGTCYIGSVRNNIEKISDLLKIPEYVFPLVGLTVGIPDEEQRVKPRLPKRAVLHQNAYDQVNYSQLLDEYDEMIKDYYQNRLTNQKDTTWTESMSAYLSKKNRIYMRDYLASQGFKLE
ncbi:oxygen-insensitive NADPH nitroreductase [Terrilactibacillus sp. BCM23-1]|uniref:Oxygen-insensitive NADPH nitroreductase n=1 Tax=Terrilactibacillus tamarindi TaxID=2599694 RepID=A0A6N8CN80_9BACI|nr:oxygen-insensitive NADPH nitroreductase [Terrilactibacillus tamarindi]MTT31532.1 oxygen-insensitive NADPH nitroreductase [Terrilactibacillus tamarindi]